MFFVYTALSFAMEPVCVRYSSHEIATQSSHFVDRGGPGQAKMASFAYVFQSEIWSDWSSRVSVSLIVHDGM